jgi:beta-glucosidase-like glycosyl hydrolase
MRRAAPPVLLCALLLLAGCSSGATMTSATTTSAAPSTSASTSTPERSSPAPAATPEAQAAAALEALDERGRVAQLFLVGVPLDDLASGDALAEDGVGGLFMAGRSKAPATELAATAQRWQALAPGPDLWVAADQEGGAVQTLKGPGFTRLPPAEDQGALPPAQLSALAGRMGAELGSAGVNLNLAPVADIVPAGTEPGNEPVGAFGRQYGSTAPEVTAAAGAVVDGLAGSGVTATLKHFPGLGRVQGNTDTRTGVVDRVTTAGDDQVATFGSLARSAARPFVMASSATYARIDPDHRAAFSSIVLTDVLRGQLGFDGVIVTDDVGNAAAVRDVDVGERAVLFLGAGGTVVLSVNPALVPEMIDAVLERSAADPAFAATVQAAVLTALEAKAHAGLLG